MCGWPWPDGERKLRARRVQPATTLDVVDEMPRLLAPQSCLFQQSTAAHRLKSRTTRGLSTQVWRTHRRDSRAAAVWWCPVEANARKKQSVMNFFPIDNHSAWSTTAARRIAKQHDSGLVGHDSAALTRQGSTAAGTGRRFGELLIALKAALRLRHSGRQRCTRHVAGCSC